MLKIRLQRKGRKHEPTYRVVLTDSKNGPKSGNFKEILGSYDSREKNINKLNGDRIKYWITNGAQVSGTVHNLLISNKIIEGTKINVLPKKTPIIKETPAEEKAEAPAEEVKAEENAPEAETQKEEVAETETAPEKPTEEAQPEVVEEKAPEAEEKKEE